MMLCRQFDYKQSARVCPSVPGILYTLYTSHLDHQQSVYSDCTKQLRKQEENTNMQRCFLYGVPACPDLAGMHSGSSVEDHRGQSGHQWMEQAGAP